MKKKESIVPCSSTLIYLRNCQVIVMALKTMEEHHSQGKARSAELI